MSFENFNTMLQVCENAEGKGSRKIMETAISELDAVGRRLCEYALNSYITFGVKKIVAPNIYSEQDGPPEPFFELCESLSKRELTGHAARDAITAVLENYTELTSLNLTKVLKKDLRTNFSANTYNKAVKGDQIPVFDVMLADKCETDEEFEELTSDEIIAEYKYDGVRSIGIYDDGKLTFYSREGKIFDYCDGLFEEDFQKIREHLGYDFIIDGEQDSGKTWEDTMNARKSTNLSAKNDLKIRAYFLMPLEDWKNKSCNLTMLQNRTQLIEICNALNLDRISVAKGKIVKGVSAVKEFCAEVTTPGFEGMEKGYEGLILKKLNAVYEWDRKMSWCKVKNFYDVDCQIVELLPGNPGTRLANTIGRVRVRGYVESGEYIESLVGSGFDDKTRDDMRDNPHNWLNSVIVVQYQEVTKGKKGGKTQIPSLRFGTFVRQRFDKFIEFNDE